MTTWEIGELKVADLLAPPFQAAEPVFRRSPSVINVILERKIGSADSGQQIVAIEYRVQDESWDVCPIQWFDQQLDASIGEPAGGHFCIFNQDVPASLAGLPLWNPSRETVHPTAVQRLRIANRLRHGLSELLLPPWQAR
jgi:hypothetical protein